ncbi:WhiB family transcriptional regulator [Calidifontibacter terrae]
MSTALADTTLTKARRKNTAEQPSGHALLVDAHPFPVVEDNELSCAQVDPDLFHSSQRSRISQAKKICQECPVLDSCLQVAIARDEWGVWGATTRAERRALARGAA